MEGNEDVKGFVHHQVEIGGRPIDYRVVSSRAARKLRLRVSTSGVEVLQPHERTSEDVALFLDKNAAWILQQLARVERLRGVRRRELWQGGEILFRGQQTKVRVEATLTRAHGNRVSFLNDEIVIERGESAKTPVARSLENWLRRQARAEIEKHLAVTITRLRCVAGRVYVRGQRTRWGSCSAERNLSFNWRLILAPDFVLRYLVTHEAVHLVVPDHSAKFWLTVQSLCHETERAKQWLCRHRAELTVDLTQVLSLPQ
jgi:predicted metal-dependent hydrolase